MKDSIRFTTFCGLDIGAIAPDHSILSLFRSELIAQNRSQPIMDEVNRQWEKKKVIIQETVVVDPSMTTSPISPKGKPKNRN